tara:strand:- start:109 stop:594 length:486 start_codon:yes stop_codon:yes gene_type:complete
MNTSLFEFGQGFKPTQEFFLEPYVLGYSVSLMNLFRSFMFKGQNWATRKSGEYMIHAFTELQRDINPLDMNTINEALMGFRGNTIFEEGMKDAELNFGAMFGMIKSSNTEPVVVEARRQAQGLQGLSSEFSQGQNDPDAGFKLAIAQLTVKQRLEGLFPEV